MDLNAIAMFTRVVQYGSFSKAARELGVTKSTVSKKVSELESQLGARLLRRTTRCLGLTDAGRRFYDECLAALSGIKQAAEVVRAETGEPRGILRVTCPNDFPSCALASLVASFLEAYPKITVDLVLSDRRLDLIAENIDVAIRIGKIADTSLRAKRIGHDRFSLLASPAYLARRGTPTAIADVEKHDCVAFLPRPDFTSWRMKKAGARVTVTPHMRFCSTSVAIVKALVQNGAGIALLPVSACRGEIGKGWLRVVLPEWSIDEPPVHLVYQREVYATPKVKAFIAHAEKFLRPVFA